MTTTRTTRPRAARAARAALAAAGALFLALPVAPPAAAADTGEARIALSAGHVGDPWRRTSLEVWGAVAEAAVRDGTIGAAEAFTLDAPDPGLQAAQLLELVEAGHDAIAIDALSATALDGAIAEACARGVVVVAFHGTVTAPCAWNVTIDHRRLGRSQVNWLAARLPEGGRLLEVRGVGGTPAEIGIGAGVAASVEAHGTFEIAASVRGGRTREQTREAVAKALPGLGPVVGVVSHGVDGLGVAEAFAAAGREVPPIVLGNRHAELAWWLERAEADGYETFSVAAPPGLSTLAFGVARRLLAGVPVPREVVAAPLVVERAALEAALGLTDRDGVYDAPFPPEAVRGLAASAD